MEKPSDKQRYKPNSYPLNFRIICLFASVALIIYASICVYYDDFSIPSRRRGGSHIGKVLHIHGYSVWILSLACLTTAANLLSYLIDHYDERNNEHKYERFSKLSAKAGWFLLFSAIILELTRAISKSF